MLELKQLELTPLEDNNLICSSDYTSDDLGLALTDKVEVTEDDRFRTINITREFENSPLGKSTKTWMQTEIIKDKWLNSKEIYIKKVFTSKWKNNGNQDVVVREIHIDKMQKKKFVEDRKLTIKVDANLTMSEVLNKMLGKNHSPVVALLN